MKARIGLIGVAVVATMILTTLFQPLSFLRAFARDNEPCRTFRETGKTVCAPFLNYWQQHGGLPIFGYPISQPLQERSALNGKPYIVQYFERAVFEQHPEIRPPDDVLLSQLGTYRFHSQYPGKDPSEPYTDNLPRYPDAQLIQIRLGTRPSEFTATMTYVTRATPEEIFAFYRDVLVQVPARFGEMEGVMVDWGMRPPLYVRPLSDAEDTALRQGLRAPDSFTVRRCQILLASARGDHARIIAAALSCGGQTVRNAIREFNVEGLNSLQRESSRPKTVMPLFDRPRAEQLRALLHRSPRDFGHETSVWTLRLAAQTCVTVGITPYRVSIETIRQALRLLDISWQRAKHWITSPDPAYAKKNAAATA